MITALFCDTETNGFPDYKMKSDSPDQPYIVQLACKLVDVETKRELGAMNHIIYPSGFVIEPKLTEIHGISTNLASRVGVQQKQVIQMFLLMMDKANYFVAHNTNFDKRMLRIAIMRSFGRATADDFRNRPHICTMQESRKHFGQSGTLGEFLKMATGEAQHSAHNAWGDVIDCEKLFFYLVDKGQISI